MNGTSRLFEMLMAFVYTENSKNHTFLFRFLLLAGLRRLILWFIYEYVKCINLLCFSLLSGGHLSRLEGQDGVVDLVLRGILLASRCRAQRVLFCKQILFFLAKLHYEYACHYVCFCIIVCFSICLFAFFLIFQLLWVICFCF